GLPTNTTGRSCHRDRAARSREPRSAKCAEPATCPCQGRRCRRPESWWSASAASVSEQWPRSYLSKERGFQPLRQASDRRAHGVARRHERWVSTTSTRSQGVTRFACSLPPSGREYARLANRLKLLGTPARRSDEEVVEHFGVDGGQGVHPASVRLRRVLVRRQPFECVQ